MYNSYQPRKSLFHWFKYNADVFGFLGGISVLIALYVVLGV